MPNGITVGDVETAVLTCVYVASKFNLKGLSEEVTIRATNKYEMMKPFKKHHVC